MTKALGRGPVVGDEWCQKTGASWRGGAPVGRLNKDRREHIWDWVKAEARSGGQMGLERREERRRGEGSRGQREREQRGRCSRLCRGWAMEWGWRLCEIDAHLAVL